MKGEQEIVRKEAGVKNQQGAGTLSPPEMITMDWRRQEEREALNARLQLFILICLCGRTLTSSLSPSGLWLHWGYSLQESKSKPSGQMPRPLLCHLPLSFPAPSGKLSSQKVSVPCLWKIHSDKALGPDKLASSHL